MVLHPQLPLTEVSGQVMPPNLDEVWALRIVRPPTTQVGPEILHKTPVPSLHLAHDVSSVLVLTTGRGGAHLTPDLGWSVGYRFHFPVPVD